MSDSNEVEIKQVIVMRHDLKMRLGKQVAQGAHASLSFLTRRLQSQGRLSLEEFSPQEKAWILGSFTKIALRCDSEDELLAIYQNAMARGIEVHLITDSGKTEFRGVPTRTCLALGPDEASKIDEITGHLKLL